MTNSLIDLQSDLLAAQTPNARLGERRPIAWLAVLFLLFILVGCAANPDMQGAAAPQPQTDPLNGVIDDLNNYVLPTPAPTQEVELSVVVSTQGSRANIRGGPGTTFPIIGKANPGDTFEVVARSEDNTWWQICCVSEQNAAAAAVTTPVTTTDTLTTTGAATDTVATAEATPANAETDTETDSAGLGWLADSVVRVAGEDDTVAISRPVFDTDFSADWTVDWQCGSERCEVQQCTANVTASVEQGPSQQLLSVNHEVVWADECFAQDAWVFEVNQYTGREESGEYEDNFLYSYWTGAEPGRPNGVYELENGETAAVYCSGPHEVEVEEGGGWTTVYEGNTCHDVRTGMLVYMAYNKRWLYTGDFEGETYEREYFGDFETLEQKLVETNAELFFVKER
jgi:hypothetical protein